MKNNNLIIIVVIIVGILIIAGAGTYILIGQNSTSDKKMVADKITRENTNSEPVIDEDLQDNEVVTPENNNSSKYTTHTKGVIEKTNGSERVLFFYANWCPTCRPVDKELNENQDQIPEGLSIIRINFNDPETEDEENELAKKYTVNYQHTFVHIDEEGNEISTWSGGGLEELLQNIK